MAQDPHNPAGDLPSDAPAEMPLPPLPRPPFWMIAIALVSVVVTWLPLAIIARARTSMSTEPRIALVQDMGIQPKFREQQTNDLFADDRAMRPKIPGTVARGDVEDDSHYYQGFYRVYDPYSGKWTVTFYDTLPDKVTITRSLLERGQQRFNIYCFPCHGADGSGHGPVNDRAFELQTEGVKGTWSQAAAIATDARIRGEASGQIFNTITNGIRSMPSYGSQIPVADRWAIVAYLRALQLSQCAPESIVPPDQVQSLQK